jgi:hypothetical protein
MSHFSRIDVVSKTPEMREKALLIENATHLTSTFQTNCKKLEKCVKIGFFSISVKAEKWPPLSIAEKLWPN